MLTYTTKNAAESSTFAGITVGTLESGSNVGTSSTALFTAAVGTSSTSVSQDRQSGLSNGITLFRDWSSFGTSSSVKRTETVSEQSNYTPSTVTQTYANTTGPDTLTDTVQATSTVSLNVSFSDSTLSSSAGHTASVNGDSYFGASTGRSSQSGYTSGSTVDTVTVDNETAGTLTTSSFPTGTVSSATAYTGSGTSREIYRETFTYDSATTTYTGSDSNCLRYTTTSSSWSTTIGTLETTSSSWNTDTTNVAHTFTSASQEPTSTLTVEGDSTRAITETYLDGTSTLTRDASTFATTAQDHREMKDTVYLLSDGGSAFLLNHMLWSITAGGPDSTTALYTGTFASSTGNSFTISDFLKISTASLAIPIVSLSRHTQVSTTGPDTNTDTAVTTITLTNGFSAGTTVSHSESWSLGDVSTSLSTSSNTAGTSSSTIFSATGFLSGYETSGALLFTTATTSTAWEATSTTGSHTAWASSYTTTATKHSRSVTEDTVLRSAYVTTSNTATTGTSFVGLSRHSTSRLISLPVTVTTNEWWVGSTASNWTSTVTAATGTGTGQTNATSVSASHNWALSTSSRLALTVSRTRLNPPGENAAWMTTPARGWAGFCGSFTQTSPAIYLTTTSGLSAGSTFTTAAGMAFGTHSMQESLGVRLVPAETSTGVTLTGEGLVSSSLISAPTALTTMLSVAATWSTSTASGSTTTATTTAATHTAAVSDAITGNFWTSYAITMDSTDVNIGQNSPHASLGGYVAGNNLQGTHEVRVMSGAVSYTQFTAGVTNTTGASGVTSGTNESVSFTVPQGAAVRIAGEPVLTLSWVNIGGGSWSGDHASSCTPHQDFTALW